MINFMRTFLGSNVDFEEKMAHSFKCRFSAPHDEVIKWKHFLRCWPFVWGIHRSPVNSPHKAQWHGALMFTLICAWINSWVNNHEAGDLRCHHAHYDVTVMEITGHHDKEHSYLRTKNVLNYTLKVNNLKNLPYLCRDWNDLGEIGQYHDDW